MYKNIFINKYSLKNNTDSFLDFYWLKEHLPRIISTYSKNAGTKSNTLYCSITVLDSKQVIHGIFSKLYK